VASKQQKADSISRYDFSEDGLSLNKLGVLRLISLVPKYPFVDGFANYDNVLEPDPRNPSNRIHYISKHQEIHKKDNFRLGCDFFAQKWENFDKTKILWLYPPRELVLKTINLVLNMELSVYLLVAVDENVPCMWAPWLESGGYWVVRVFTRKFDKRGLYVKISPSLHIEKFCDKDEILFHLAGFKIPAKSQYFLLVSKMAKLLLSKK